MKLTKLHKEAFVRAVMADLPNKKAALGEQYRKLIEADMLKTASPKLRAALMEGHVSIIVRKALEGTVRASSALGSLAALAGIAKG